MKTFLTTLLLCISGFIFAQNTDASIEYMDMNVLYRGYANKIVIGADSSDFSSLYLTGADVDITSNGDYYIVKPKSSKTARLDVIAIRKDGTEEIIRSKEYQVSNLPDPSLHWGFIPSGKAVYDQKPELSCKYVGHYPLQAEFKIVAWSAGYEDQVYREEGADLSSLNEVIANFTELTEFTIVAKVLGPDGITRQLSGTWFVRPSSE